MSFFLPARPSAEQQVLVDQLKEGTVARLLMVAISGGNGEQRAVLSRDLRGRLANMSEFVAVQNGEAGSHDAARDFLFRHRYLLSPAVTSERFTIDGLRTAISDSIDRLASSAGMLLKPMLPRDPTGELFDLLGQLNPGAQPSSHAGVWASPDGNRALLLVQTRAPGADTDGQEAAIQAIRTQFTAVAAAAGIGDARLQLSGPGLFAVKSRALIKHEVTRLSAIGTLAIVAVLFFVYRSPRLLTLGLLPVLSGALAGIVGVSLAYGTVFGITVGFGSALIGEAVDYSIYYFVQSGRSGVAAWKARFWPTIRLGVLTSACGFGVLLFSGFPGLAQLGLYALSGVTTAALVTRFVLPHMAGEGMVMRDLGPLGATLKDTMRAVRRLRWPALVLALAATAYLAVEHDRLWSPNLSVLSTTSPEDAAADMALRADLGTSDSRFMVVVNGYDREAALQAAEQAGQALDKLQANGTIVSYENPGRFLPSRALQTARRASLPSTAQLRSHLQVALADLPLSADKLEGFIADIAAARQAPDIERSDLNGTGLGLAVDALLLQRPSGWSAVLPLRLPDKEQVNAIAAVQQALAGSGALTIDLKGELDTLYNNYLREAMLLALTGFAAIIALLAATLRSLRRLAAVLLPLALAVLLVVAGLHLSGEHLHLLHLVGMLLIVAVGSNYALFFDHAGELDPTTLASMGIATLTTTIGFGTLSLSQVPMLHAIGVTVGPGAFLALLLAAMFVPRETAT
jgi:predicted exporter